MLWKKKNNEENQTQETQTIVKIGWDSIPDGYEVVNDDHGSRLVSIERPAVELPQFLGWAENNRDSWSIVIADMAEAQRWGATGALISMEPRLDLPVQMIPEGFCVVQINGVYSIQPPLGWWRVSKAFLPPALQEGPQILDIPDYMSVFIVWGEEIQIRYLDGEMTYIKPSP